MTKNRLGRVVAKKKADETKVKRTITKAKAPREIRDAIKILAGANDGMDVEGGSAAASGKKKISGKQKKKQQRIVNKNKKRARNKKEKRKHIN